MEIMFPLFGLLYAILGVTFTVVVLLEDEELYKDFRNITMLGFLGVIFFLPLVIFTLVFLSIVFSTLILFEKINENRWLNKKPFKKD